MIIGPWGEVLDERPSGAGFVQAEINLAELARLRQQFPVLEHRREF
jgi:predicted amidohydrolase